MSTLSAPALPSARVIQVDTRGAVILSEESPEVCIAFTIDENDATFFPKAWSVVNLDTR